jgi:hypothetical protein
VKALINRFQPLSNQEPLKNRGFRLITLIDTYLSSVPKISLNLPDLLTLDQHIGVRIPGGQPNFLQYLRTFPDTSRLRPIQNPCLCRHCVATWLVGSGNSGTGIPEILARSVVTGKTSSNLR